MVKKQALPYMGNIHREVRPISRISRRRRESKAVKMISMHQPARPHLKNFFSIIVVVLWFVMV